MLEAGHWELADKYLTADYHQHNAQVKSGRDNVIAFFTQVLKTSPKPIPAKLETPIVSVVAEGDYVIVAYPRVMKDSKDPSKSYTTTWFDMWRFVDGEADEHWDGATLGIHDRGTSVASTLRGPPHSNENWPGRQVPS